MPVIVKSPVCECVLWPTRHPARCVREPDPGSFHRCQSPKALPGESRLQHPRPRIFPQTESLLTSFKSHTLLGFQLMCRSEHCTGSDLLRSVSLAIPRTLQCPPSMTCWPLKAHPRCSAPKVVACDPSPGRLGDPPSPWPPSASANDAMAKRLTDCSLAISLAGKSLSQPPCCIRARKTSRWHAVLAFTIRELSLLTWPVTSIGIAAGIWLKSNPEIQSSLWDITSSVFLGRENALSVTSRGSSLLE